MLARLLALSVIFWSAVALYSCDGRAARPTDLAPADTGGQGSKAAPSYNRLQPQAGPDRAS